MDNDLVIDSVVVYAVGDTIQPITIDKRFRNISIVVEPWSVVTPPANLLDIIKDANNLVLSGATGTATLSLKPRFTYRKYLLPNDEGVIDLASPHFVNVGAPTEEVHVTLTAPTGCTHISIGVIGVPY